MPIISSSRIRSESMMQSTSKQPQSSDEIAVSASTNSSTNSSRIAEQKGKAKSTFVISRLGFDDSKSSMGDRIIAEITSGDVDHWIQSLNVGPQTQNNFRAVLSAMWTFAVRRGYAATNVIQLVDKTSVVRDHIPTFSVEQLTRLLAAAPPDYLPVLVIGAFAGLRPEEINKLQWEDLDFHERTIRVNASAAKTRKKRFAEISDNLAGWLKPYAGRTGPVAPPNLQKLRRATMKAAKIEKWPPDVLRHSFASAHYAFHRDPARTAVDNGSPRSEHVADPLSGSDEAK